jgi:hypothetical protein
MITLQENAKSGIGITVLSIELEKYGVELPITMDEFLERGLNMKNMLDKNLLSREAFEKDIQGHSLRLIDFIGVRENISTLLELGKKDLAIEYLCYANSLGSKLRYMDTIGDKLDE